MLFGDALKPVGYFSGIFPLVDQSAGADVVVNSTKQYLGLKRILKSPTMKSQLLNMQENRFYSTKADLGSKTAVAD